MKKLILAIFFLFGTSIFAWGCLEDGKRVFMVQVFDYNENIRGMATVGKMNFGDVSYPFTVNLGKSYSFYVDEKGDTKGAMMIDNGEVKITKFFVIGDYGFAFFLDKKTVSDMKKGRNVFFYIETETEDISVTIPLNNFSSSFDKLK